jgi:hypothetical protein
MVADPGQYTNYNINNKLNIQKEKLPAKPGVLILQ